MQNQFIFLFYEPAKVNFSKFEKKKKFHLKIKICDTAHENILNAFPFEWKSAHYPFIEHLNTFEKQLPSPLQCYEASYTSEIRTKEYGIGYKCMNYAIIHSHQNSFHGSASAKIST